MVVSVDFVFSLLCITTSVLPCFSVVMFSRITASGLNQSVSPTARPNIACPANFNIGLKPSLLIFILM